MSTQVTWAGRPSALRVAVRVGRVLAATIFVTTALIGAVVAPWPWMLLYAPAVGALAGGTVALARSGSRQDAASRRTVVHAAVVGFLAVPFGAGLPALGGAGGVVVLFLLVVASLVAADWLAEEQPGPPVAGAAELRSVVGALPTQDLVHAWLGTEDLLRSAREHRRVAELREVLLDELARRDPAGVAEWLAAGGRSPVPHISVDRDTTGT
ncbi:hypothetical protein GCU60_01895 [Blastococcus saxobsidens]|uniref:Uncharacterized protein n=1 Tax=Blastococcus saxobsidens TaxID=138336 RepID=A0A6L9VXW9_9ACTN|nr:hypothetical protein [Blastococcus saxobsidens]NEK84518.1 hypothetical protein [Blastococcus saxobsidens]